jgi:acetyltransferase
MEPRSVAVVGASRDPKSVGYGVLKSLLSGCVKRSPWGCRGFGGKVYAVNPHAKTVLGTKCYASISQITGEIDVAVISVPAAVVPQVAQECGQKGVKALVVISAGFGETGEEGKALESQLMAACKRHGMRLLGPNCLGLLRPSLNYNASFALSSPPAGGVALVTQSGALADSVIDWAIQEKYAFSAIVSLGNAIDLDAADFVNYLANDPATKVITLYLEGVRDGRKLMSAASRSGKPVLLLKGGKTAEGGKAVASHTGALAGDGRVFEGAMRQAGVRMAESLEELFDLAKTLAEQPRARENAIAVITNGGGLGVLASDYCKEFGVNLPALKATTIAKLDASGLMHPAYSRRNPLDLVGDALPQRYETALNTVLAEDYISGAIVLQTVQTMTDSRGDAEAVVAARKRFPGKPIVCVFMGGKYVAQGVNVLRKAGVPDFNDPRKAVKAMAALCSAP